MGATLPFDTIAELRRTLVAAVPHLKLIDQVPENEWLVPEASDLGSGDFGPALAEHYQPNAIARASELMAELAKRASERKGAPLAAE